MTRSSKWDDGSEMPSRVEGLARGLGYFSIGLGLVQLLVPRALSQIIGAPKRSLRSLQPVVGVRELLTGIGLITQEKHQPWLLGRIAGDFMDLALLSSVFNARRADRRRLGWAIGVVSGITALDTIAALGLNGPRIRSALSRSREVNKAITVRRSPEEVYAFWRDLSHLPQFMAHIVSIEQIDRDRSHWVVRAPAGRTIEWDAEICEDLPSNRIAWRVLPGAPVIHEGVVRFEPAPGNRGTEVHVRLTYEAPLGTIGALMAKLFGEEPSQQIDGDLRRLKQVLETGEIMRSDASMGHALQPARPQSKPSPTDGAGTRAARPAPEVRS